MATAFLMPKAGITMTEGTIVRWLKRAGEPVRRGEPLVEIMTDKVNQEFESLESGIVLKILGQEGHVFPCGEPIAYIGQPGELAPEASGPTAAAGEVVAAVLAAAADPVAQAGARARATPAARAVARQLGLDLGEMQGTGPGGLVLKEDVLAAAEAMSAVPPAPDVAAPTAVLASPIAGAAPAPAPPTSSPAIGVASATPLPPARISSKIPLVGLRRIIAQRMTDSAFTIPRAGLCTEADVTELVQLRERVVDRTERQLGFRVSYNDFFVRIVARALRQHPTLNARLGDNEIEILADINVGVAVAVPDGLVVPVIHNADQKDLLTIAHETRDKIARARAGTITMDDVSGGTFTLSNMGPYEMDVVLPIINSPEAAILGIGRIIEKPVAYKGQVCLRSMVCLSLILDHRLNDGVPSAEFLRGVKRGLENPEPMLL